MVCLIKHKILSLIITEGEKFEPNLCEYLLVKAGMKVHKLDTIDEFKRTEYTSDNAQVYIVQGPKNRISSLVKTFHDYDDLAVYYELEGVFAHNYLLYDVDYTTNDELKDFYNKFHSPQLGWLIVSNPCIEVLADKLLELHDGKSSEYKKIIQGFLQKNNGNKRSIQNYIKENIEDLLIFHIQKNVDRFQNTNILEHPDKAIDEIIRTNKMNENPEENGQRFEYLITVLYVIFAEIMELTKQVDNSQIVIDYLLKMKIKV